MARRATARRGTTWVLCLLAGAVASCDPPAPNRPPPPTPPPTPPPQMVVAAAGDVSCAPVSPFACRQMETADLLTRLAPELVLVPGDTQYERGELANFQRMYEPSWGRMKGITRPVPGNHEYATPRAAGYFDYFNGPGQFTGPAGDRDKGFYTFEAAGWRVVGLNSECAEVRGCERGSFQEQWLRDVLARSFAICTLVYVHRPLVSSGPNGPNPEMKPLWDALHDANADVVLAGHDHLYERMAPIDPAGQRDPVRGIRQFTIGTGGHSLYAFRNPPHPASEARFNQEFGVLRLVLRTGGYDWRFVTVNDAVIDSGTAACH